MLLRPSQSNLAEQTSVQTLIRAMTDDDAEAVLAIYREGIASGNATFQADAPSWEGWSRGHLGDCRLIAEIDGTVAGWAALAPISSRPVYRGVVEVSLYVGVAYQGRGVGNTLLGALIERSEANGFWILISGIFPDSLTSIMPETPVS
jgi:phosphinothricin acetyltransferase